MHELAAIRAALVDYYQPLRSRKITAEYPKGIIEVIKVAAGDMPTIEALSNDLQVDEKTLQEAASFYLQQLHFKHAKTPFQKLGLSDSATVDEVTQHKRWLLKWLHPDRNPNKWQTSMFQSVTDAAQHAAVLAATIRPSPTMPSEPRRQHENLSRNRKQNLVMRPRKPVRVILWKEVLSRISRKLVLLVVFGLLLYMGTSQISDPMKQWTHQAYLLWYDN
jgi:hypothetical protein